MNQTESSIEKDDGADDDDDEMLLGLSVKCYVGVEPAGERYKLCDLSRGLRTCYIKYDMCKLDIMPGGSPTFPSYLLFFQLVRWWLAAVPPRRRCSTSNARSTRWTISWRNFATVVLIGATVHHI